MPGADPLIDALAVMGDQGWLLLLFAAITLTVFGAFNLFRGPDPVERRLAHGSSEAAPAEPPASVRPRDEAGLLRKFDAYLTPQEDAEKSRLRERLTRAGYRSRAAIRLYYLSRAALGLGLSLVVALLSPLLATDLAIERIVLLTLLCGLTGLYLPTIWVSLRTHRRQSEMRDAFPDALDMLLVCVEAGQGLDAALNRVAEEIGAAHPHLAEEFLIVGLQLRAGKGRNEVLRDMAHRVAVDEISAFVTVLIQSDRFGTSIGDALRVYAADMRAKRMVRAEEKANKLPVKLALGTIVCTVPPVMLILAGPSLIMAIRTLRKLVE